MLCLPDPLTDFALRPRASAKAWGLAFRPASTHPKKHPCGGGTFPPHGHSWNREDDRPTRPIRHPGGTAIGMGRAICYIAAARDSPPRQRWLRRPVSNRRPSGYGPDALPSELPRVGRQRPYAAAMDETAMDGTAIGRSPPGRHITSARRRNRSAFRACALSQAA